jgi:hypothetical protein
LKLYAKSVSLHLTYNCFIYRLHRTIHIFHAKEIYQKSAKNSYLFSTQLTYKNSQKQSNIEILGIGGTQQNAAIAAQSSSSVPATPVTSSREPFLSADQFRQQFGDSRYQKIL